MLITRLRVCVMHKTQEKLLSAIIIVKVGWEEHCVYASPLKNARHVNKSYATYMDDFLAHMSTYSKLQIGWHSISRSFLKLVQRTRILPMGFMIAMIDEFHENSGTTDTKLNVFRNNLKVLCHTICNWRYRWFLVRCEYGCLFCRALLQKRPSISICEYGWFIVRYEYAYRWMIVTYECELWHMNVTYKLWHMNLTDALLSRTVTNASCCTCV